MKFAKIFSREINPLYGITYLEFTELSLPVTASVDVVTDNWKVLNLPPDEPVRKILQSNRKLNIFMEVGMIGMKVGGDQE